ncbi:MAG: acyl-protein synthetase [Clostridiales bacterium]|nr:acyl-protein synthetase [Clostridiales bacterium]
MDINDIIDIAPFSLEKGEKTKLITEKLANLTKHHYENCREYHNMLDACGFDPYHSVESYEDIPFLPVRLFKELTLKSVPEEEIFKTMTSSGTTGQSVSKIYLDRETSNSQQKVLVKIVSSFLGSARLPMIIADCPSVVKDRKMFSARGAGILGFSIFGAEKIYALNDEMQLNISGLHEFLDKHKGKSILMFGFTFMIWQHFLSELLKYSDKLDLSNVILIHGGGWKKLITQKVSQQEFKDRLNSICGIRRVHDYYGMVEQTGCIYVECEKGHLHASVFSDVITRRPNDLSVCEYGEKGIVEVVSVLPKSYPGHILLTEDEGIVLGEDNCECGRKGKFFTITGRIKNAELRGCGDTYAAGF